MVCIMKFKEWDFPQIIREICYVREKPIDEHVADSVVEELRKLNFYGWDKICQVAETVMSKGRYELNNNLWIIVRTAVNHKLAEVKIKKPQFSKFQNENMAGFQLIELHQKVIKEIDLWVKYSPPLKFKGVNVVNRTEYYTPVGYDIEDWHSNKRPKLKNILLDNYMSLHYDSLIEEEQRQLDGIMSDRLSNFLKTLQDLRVAQIKHRTKEVVHAKTD